MDELRTIGLIDTINLFLYGTYFGVMLFNAVDMMLMRTRMHRRIAYGLVVWTILVVLGCFRYVSLMNGATFDYNIFFLIDLTCIPTVLHIIWTVTGTRPPVKYVLVMHELPFVLAVIIYFFTHSPWVYYGAMALGSAYAISIAVRFYGMFHLYHRTVLNNYSNIAGRNLYWLYRMVFIFPLILVAFLVGIFWHGTWTRTLYLVFAIPIWSYMIHYLRQHRIVDIEAIDRLVCDCDADSYQPVAPEDEDRMYPFHEEYFSVTNNARFYRRPDLMLEELADRLNIRRERLIEYMNRQVGMNFYEYINSQRLRYVCDYLMGTDMTLEEMADDAGFADKRTIDHFFKEEYGYSAQEYRDGKR